MAVALVEGALNPLVTVRFGIILAVSVVDDDGRLECLDSEQRTDLSRFLQNFHVP